jgi:hypothetical protein
MAVNLKNELADIKADLNRIPFLAAPAILSLFGISMLVDNPTHQLIAFLVSFFMMALDLIRLPFGLGTAMAGLWCVFFAAASQSASSL